LDRLSL